MCFLQYYYKVKRKWGRRGTVFQKKDDTMNWAKKWRNIWIKILLIAMKFVNDLWFG